MWGASAIDMVEPGASPIDAQAVASAIGGAGRFCRTWRNSSAEGSRSENDRETRRTPMRTLAPIFNGFRRRLSHWAGASALPLSLDRITQRQPAVAVTIGPCPEGWLR